MINNQNLPLAPTRSSLTLRPRVDSTQAKSPHTNKVQENSEQTERKVLGDYLPDKKSTVEKDHGK